MRDSQRRFFYQLALSFLVCPPVLAQTCNLAGSPTTTTKAPLVSGASSTPPLIPAPEGQPPAVGDGSTPSPVVPGMTGPPTLLPWVPAIPSNQIDQSFSGIPMPVTPAVESPPGVLGPALTPVIPEPPSTPGVDPGSLTAPAGSVNPAAEVPIDPAGGIPGTGGYCTTIPTQRRGGQETHQYELRGYNSSMGGLPDDGSQDIVELLGPMAGWGMPFGIPTGNGLRNSSIDLGGGMRMDPPGSDTTISTGSSVQDYGLSSTRDNPMPALNASQSTEFGQGLRRVPIESSKTTDFGMPFSQYSPANVTPEKQDQLLVPTAIITNF